MVPGIAVLFGGGIESTVLTRMAAATGELKHLFLCDYGQATFREQEFAMLTLARDLRINAHTFHIDYGDWVDPGTRAHPGFHAGRNSGAYRREQMEEFYAGDLYLNGRNPLLILSAAAQASYRGINRLWVGFQLNDDEIGGHADPAAAPMDDTDDHTIQLCNQLIRLSFRSPFLVHAPLLNMNKRQVVAMARGLGFDISGSYSCEFSPACGVCSQCQDRQEAMLAV